MNFYTTENVLPLMNRQKHYEITLNFFYNCFYTYIAPNYILSYFHTQSTPQILIYYSLSHHLLQQLKQNYAYSRVKHFRQQKQNSSRSKFDLYTSPTTSNWQSLMRLWTEISKNLKNDEIWFIWDILNDEDGNICLW